MIDIPKLRAAAGRLHAAAWHGAKVPAGRATGIRFSIPRDSEHSQLMQRVENVLVVALDEGKPAKEESEKKKVTFEIPSGTRPSRCTSSSCGAEIFWIKTAAGKNMPVDADGQPHWATCPAAKSFKRDGAR